MNPSRRRFLEAAALAGIGGVFGRFPSVSAAEAKVTAEMVRFRPEIEPLVRLLESTSRDRLLEEIGQRIKGGGLSCRDVVAALLLAGIRNIQPRPVGFKFHAVLVVNSAYLASLNSPDSDRWLPIFWALDQFKVSQARDVEEGDWTMPAVFESAVPSADKAGSIFTTAMDAWDAECADAAAAGLARGVGAQQVFDLMCRYGARDYRDIGHKAIYVANSWRTLQTIGWQHAEPVLRSLAYALLSHNDENPSKRDDLADRPGRKNLERIREIRAAWEGGTWEAGTTTEMLGALRTSTWDEASAKAVELLNRGSSPQALWDAMFEYATELLVRSPGIVSLHASTTTNALHFAFQHAANDETRRFLLLQNASFLTLFRNDAEVKEGFEIDHLEPLAPGATDAGAVEEIFAGLSADRMLSARKTLSYLQSGGNPKTFMDAAQRLIYLKGTDAHDYKFSSAVIEDYQHLSPAVRDRFLAASVFWLKGSDERDNTLVARSRAAL
jgi:hypothetical protein